DPDAPSPPSAQPPVVLPVLRVSRGLPPEECQEAPAGNRYVLGALLSLESGLPRAQRTAPAELARLTLGEYLQRHAPAPGAGNGATPRVLIFDQFEEILTLDSTDQP